MENRLINLNDVSDVEILWYSDGEDGSALLNQYIDHESPLGIDKCMAARFLLRLFDLNAAQKYLIASDCVDDNRACKDSEELE